MGSIDRNVDTMVRNSLLIHSYPGNSDPPDNSDRHDDSVVDYDSTVAPAGSGDPDDSDPVQVVAIVVVKLILLPGLFSVSILLWWSLILL